MFGWNCQILGGPFSNPLKKRRGGFAPVIPPLLRIVQDDRYAQLGIVRRKKANKRGIMLGATVATIDNLLRGASLSGDGVKGHLRSKASTVRRDGRLQSSHDFLRGL